MTTLLRMADRNDAAAMLAIYEPIVRETAISFELEPPTLSVFRERIEQSLPLFPWLVCEVDRDVAGYAYAGRFRQRPAYRWTAEVAVYVHGSAQNRGVGGALYEALLACLRLQGYQSVMAGIALPNEGSVRLHARAGFERVGVIRRAGFKNGAWHDVSWWQKILAGSAAASVVEPRPLQDVVDSSDWPIAVSNAQSRIL